MWTAHFSETGVACQHNYLGKANYLFLNADRLS